MKKSASKKPNIFGDLGDMLSAGGLDNIFLLAGADKPTYSLIDEKDIHVLPQQRNAAEIENEDQTIADLAASIKADGLIQPIVLVKTDAGWRLVCGERRFRACGLIGLNPIPSLCYESLTEDQIQRIQFAENIHRLNLSQINEAQILKIDIETCGSVEAVMEMRNKSASWISKRLALLDLPTETTRLLTENITADLEVINTVRQIEKVSPEIAAETVAELKENLGKKGVNARDTAKKAKDKVKPPKKAKAPLNTQEEIESGGITQRKQDEEQRGFTFDSPELLDLLSSVYTSIYALKKEPKMVYQKLSIEQRTRLDEWLRSYYEAGMACQNLAGAVIQGFRNATFGNTGHATFALIAFLNGGERRTKFNVLDIIGTVKV